MSTPTQPEHGHSLRLDRCPHPAAATPQSEQTNHLPIVEPIPNQSSPNPHLPAHLAIATPQPEQLNQLPVVEHTPNQNPSNLVTNPPPFSFSGAVLFPNLNRGYMPTGSLTTIPPSPATVEHRKRTSEPLTVNSIEIQERNADTDSQETSITPDQPERITKVRVVGASVESEALTGLRNKNGRLKNEVSKRTTRK
jgi:hypothetical protein